MKGKRLPSLAELRSLLAGSREDAARRLGISIDELDAVQPDWQSLSPGLRLMAMLLVRLHQLAAAQNAACAHWALGVCPEDEANRQPPATPAWVPEAERQLLPVADAEAMERCRQCAAEKRGFLRLAQLPAGWHLPPSPELN